MNDHTRKDFESLAKQYMLDGRFRSDHVYDAQSFVDGAEAMHRKLTDPNGSFAQELYMKGRADQATWDQSQIAALNAEVSDWKAKYIDARRSGYEEGLEDAKKEQIGENNGTKT